MGWNKRVWSWLRALQAISASGQVEAIFIEAFPAGQREPFGDLVGDINDGHRRLHCASTRDRVVGFGVIRALPGSPVVLVEYFATERTLRGHGVGARLLQAIVQHLRDNADTAAVVLEAESDRHGSPAERLLKARRIAFYQRNGARTVEAVTDYRMPNLAGPGSFPMKLLWLPIGAEAEAPQGEALEDLILRIYGSAYHRGADDPLVQAALSSVRSDPPRITRLADFEHDGVDAGHERRPPVS